ncbi:MAG: hypothetical protein ACK56F_03935, partial [bacterium]
SHSHPKMHQEGQFDPYVNNEGTCVGVGGPGFCILAGETRMSLGYDIVSRKTSRVFFNYNERLHN